MSKTSHNKTFFGIVMACMLGALLIGFVAWLSSCNAPKRASQLFDKAARKDYPTVADKCGKAFPPVSGRDSSVIYKEGVPIVTHDTQTFVEFVNDTVYRTKYIIQNTLKRDTVDRYWKVTVHNKGVEDALTAQLNTAVQTIATKGERIRWWRLGCIAGLGYVLIRWIVLYFTKGKIKLP